MQCEKGIAPPSVFLNSPRRVSTGRSLPEEHLGDGVERRVHRLEIRRRFRERDRHDLVPPERRHLAELAAVDHVGGLHSEAGGENAIEGRRRSPALDVPEHGDACLVAGLRLDEVRELLADPAEGLGLMPEVPVMVMEASGGLMTVVTARDGSSAN